jgi:hypothetical protein
MDIFGFDTAKAWDYENGFNLTADPTRLGKIVSHYELSKRIIGLPGQVVELGVFKGGSLIRFLTFRNLLESPHSRTVIGFDAFGRFPGATDPHDERFIEAWEQAAGQGLSVEELTRALAHKGLTNFELVQGDITETAPAYVRAHPALKIALLHIDTDTYEPAMAGLTCFWERLVPGGLLVLDDYGTEYGGTRAVDDFFRNAPVILHKLPISHTCPSFIVKGETP